MKRVNLRRVGATGLLLALLLCGCAPIEDEQQGAAGDPGSVQRPGEAESGQDEQPPEPELTEEEKLALRAQELLADMTLEQKVGQLFMIRPEALAENTDSPVTAWSDELDAALAQYPAGGVVLFGQNVVSPEQLTALTGALAAAGQTPLFIGVDEEGGAVARIAGNEAFDVARYDSMAQVGAIGDPAQAREVGQTIGTYLAEYGFNLDFAPVADVNTNPDNTVIGDRAFGSDPQLAAQMVCAEIEGLHQAGIMSCIKHFPGHGDTRGDTHDGTVTVDKTWEELLGCELVPFIAALDSTDMVMAAHITAPGVTSDGLPASLSHEMVTGRLRSELGYDGVVVTDSLEMGAIAGQYTSAESAVLAISAGVDIVLMPLDYTEAFEGILQAVRDGELTEERIDQSVLRILTLKITQGIIE